MEDELGCGLRRLWGMREIYIQYLGGETRIYFKEFVWEGMNLIICHRTWRGDGLL